MSERETYTPEQMAFGLAQLRHAYVQAINGNIGDQSSYGRYLLAPAIARVEVLQQAYAIERARAEAAEQHVATLRESTLPALRVSLENEILPGIVASAQAWEAQRAERAVRLLITALRSQDADRTP